MPSLDERLLAGLTSDMLVAHLTGRGWVRAEQDAPGLVVFKRPLESRFDYTAVPIGAPTDDTRLQLACGLAASAHRDGLDLAQLADALGL